MCCFTGFVEFVANTKIFTRMENAIQFLVYEMTFSSQEDLAMVLPIPVAAGAAENAVDFISMEDSPEFFNLLDEMFPIEMGEAEAGDLAILDEPVAASILEVHQVGCFEASFVPQRKDFERLDTRFRLPDNVWDSCPGIADYGFVVFKLKRGENQAVHPMAFSFPTRQPDKLFFPTVHIHDGEYHDRAEFDHGLYAQMPAGIKGWDKSEETVKQTQEGFPVEGWIQDLDFPGPERWDAVIRSNIVNRDQYCYRIKIEGQHNNTDIWAPLNP